MWGAIIGAGISAGAGYLINRENRRRQLEQQNALNANDFRWNTAMLNQQQQSQYDMWLKTNYPEQVKQMKAAGLNPALLYSNGGGGGITGNASGGNFHSQVGKDTERDALGLQKLSQVMQAMLMKSQKENLDADTNLKNANAEKISGVDTQETSAKIGNILADTNNKWAQNTGIQLDNNFKEIQNYIAGNTKDISVDKIKNDLEYSIELVDQIRRNNYINETLKELSIAKAQKEFEKLAVDIIYIQQQTDESKERIAQRWNELKLGWKNLEWDQIIEQKQLEVQITKLRNEQEKNRIMKAFQETDKYFKEKRLNWDKEAFKKRMAFEYINMGVSNAVSIGKSFIPTAGAGSAGAVNPKLNSVNGSNPNNVSDFETLLPTLLDY